MKSKILISFMILSLVLNIFSGFALGLGEQTDYKEDYEDDTLSQNATDSYYGGVWVTTESNSANCYVNNIQAVDSNSFQLYLNSQVYQNFTYSNSTFILNLSIRWIPEDFIVAESRHFYVYNNTGQVWLHWYVGAVGGAYQVYWEDYDSTDLLGAMHDGWKDQINWMNLTIMQNDSIRIEFRRGDNPSGSYVIGTNLAPYMVLDNPRIAGINYTTDDTGGDGRLIHYIDNIEILEFGLPESPEDEDATIPPCTPYSTIGNVGVGSHSVGVGYQYMWTTYYVETRMNVHRLDLQIGPDMYNHYTANDIECKLATYDLGTADSIVELEAGGSARVSWTGLNCYINNTMTPIMFKFNVNYGGQVNFYAEIYIDDGHDINNDGLSYSVYTNNHEYWNNFANHLWNDPNPNPANPVGYSVQFYEPILRLCVDFLGTSEIKDHIDNDIWCSPVLVVNNSFTEIGYSLNLSLMGGTNKFILVQRPDGTSQNIFSISTQTGHKTYTAHQQGLHYINLSIDGVNVSSTFINVSGNADNWLESIDNPSEPNENFDIYYNYSEANTGAIRIFDHKDNLKKTFFVNPESSGLETTNLPSGKYYIRLQEIITVAGSNQYVTKFTLPHSVQAQVVDYIEVYQDVTTVDFGFRAYGQHNHVGENIVVRYGMSEEIDVSDTTDFSIWCYPTKSDYYRVSLVLKKPDGSELELDWDYVTVKSTLFDEKTQTPLENLMDSVPDFYKILAGIIITIIITISPILLLSQIAQFSKVPMELKVPAIIYPILAIAGTLLCVTLGLYGIEITFFFLAICVLAGFLTYYTGKGGNE